MKFNFGLKSLFKGRTARELVYIGVTLFFFILAVSIFIWSVTFVTKSINAAVQKIPAETEALSFDLEKFSAVADRLEFSFSLPKAVTPAYESSSDSPTEE